MTDQIERALDALEEAREEEAPDWEWMLRRNAGAGGYASVPGLEGSGRAAGFPPAPAEHREVEWAGADRDLTAGLKDGWDQRGAALTGETMAEPGRDWEWRAGPEGMAERSEMGESLYQRVRRAGAAAEYAARSRGRQDPVRVAEAAGRGLDPMELDRIFQRDARRYDGGFSLY